MDISEDIDLDFVDDRPGSSVLYEPLETNHDPKSVQEFMHDQDLKLFFLNVQTFFFNFQKAFLYTADSTIWLLWYNKPTESVCFCIQEREFPRRLPVYRIKIKDVPLTQTSDTMEIEDINTEAVEYSTCLQHYIGNKLSPEGFPSYLSKLLPDMHDVIQKTINSEKTEYTIGKNGMLKFLIHVMTSKDLHETAIETNSHVDDLNTNTCVKLTFRLLENVLYISENKLVIPDYSNPSLPHKDIFMDYEMEYMFKFQVKSFPDSLRLIHVEQKETTKRDPFLQPNVQTRVNVLTAKLIDENFFRSPTKQTIMVNFLEYALHYFLYTYGVCQIDVPRSAPHYSNIKMCYHQLTLEHLPWFIFRTYLKYFKEERSKLVQVGTLHDNLSLPDSVDLGGPTREFIYHLSCQIFRYQTKTILLHSMSKNSMNYLSKISLYSNEIRFPIFYRIYDEKEKLRVAYDTVKFFKVLYFHGLKLPFILDKQFFFYFQKSRELNMNYFHFTDLRHVNMRKVQIHLANEAKQMQGRSMQSILFSYYDIYKEYIYSYRVLMYKVTISLNSHEDERKNNKSALHTATLLDEYFVPVSYPKTLKQCFHVRLEPSLPETKLLQFKSEILTLLSSEFLNHWCDVDEKCILENFDYSLGIKSSPTITMNPTITSSHTKTRSSTITSMDELRKQKYLFIISHLKSNPDFMFSQSMILFIFNELFNIIKNLYNPIIEFIMYMRKVYHQYSNSEEDIFKWDELQYSTLAGRLMQEKMSRKEIADAIVLHHDYQEYSMNTLFLEKMKWLKEHIVDETTSDVWVQQFVKAVTGSPSMNADDRIYLQPVVFSVNMYYTAHTCFNILDINSNSNECPGLDSDSSFFMNPKHIFIKNLSDGLLAHNEHMLYA